MLTIKRLTYKNAENIIILQEKVINSLGQKALFYPATLDELIDIIKFTGYAVGLYDNEQLIGYATIIFCSLDNQLKDLYQIPNKYIPTTAVLDDVAILTEYRGKKYQLLLWNYIASHFCFEKQYLLASIHPQNIASLRNAYYFKMKIIAKKIMYNNTYRYILLKRI